MNSIPFFDDRHPIRTVYTDSSDWQNHAGWQYSDVRNAVLQGYLGIPLKRIRYARQTHSGSVLSISDESKENLEVVEENNILGPSGGYDAMVTTAPGVMLCIWTADCLPLFLYDPKKGVAAIAHCGWRGICNGIVPNTVSVMTKRFGASPEHIIAAFGPGICRECYEVGEELIEAFSGRFSPDEVRAIFNPKQNGNHLLNLRRAVTLELSFMGMHPEMIHDIGICSYESETYASYRRDGPSELGKLTLSGIVLE